MTIDTPTSGALPALSAGLRALAGYKWPVGGSITAAQQSAGALSALAASVRNSYPITDATSLTALSRAAEYKGSIGSIAAAQQSASVLSALAASLQQSEPDRVHSRTGVQLASPGLPIHDTAPTATGLSTADEAADDFGFEQLSHWHRKLTKHDRRAVNGAFLGLIFAVCCAMPSISDSKSLRLVIDGVGILQALIVLYLVVADTFSDE